MVGAPLTELDNVLINRCGSTTNTACLDLHESPVVPAENRADCTVATLAFDPKPQPGPGPDDPGLLQRGTRVDVTTDCSNLGQA